MIYRITFGFSGSTGWGETHAMLAPTTRPQDLAPTLIDIGQKRAQMLGREWSINAIRIAKYASEDGTRQKGTYLAKVNLKNSVTSAAADGEPASVALLVRGTAEPSVVQPQFDSNSNQTFLGGPLDVSVEDGGTVNPAKGNLGASFASWRSVMISAQLGWLARSVIAEDVITAVDTLDSGLVSFTVPADVVGAMTAGVKYQARIRGLNEGRSPLNGELQVMVGSPTTLVSVKPLAYTYEQIGGHIRVYKPVLTFVDYGGLELSLQAAKHKRGRPFGLPPGRAARRVRA